VEEMLANLPKKRSWRYGVPFAFYRVTWSRARFVFSNPTSTTFRRVSTPQHASLYFSLVIHGCFALHHHICPTTSFASPRHYEPAAPLTTTSVFQLAQQVRLTTETTLLKASLVARLGYFCRKSCASWPRYARAVIVADPVS
jgi:hypothetical protein